MGAARTTVAASSKGVTMRHRVSWNGGGLMPPRSDVRVPGASSRMRLPAVEIRIRMLLDEEFKGAPVLCSIGSPDGRIIPPVVIAEESDAEHRENCARTEL